MFSCVWRWAWPVRDRLLSLRKTDNKSIRSFFMVNATIGSLVLLMCQPLMQIKLRLKLDGILCPVASIPDELAARHPS